MLYCLVGNLQSTLWHQIRLKSRAGSNSSPFVSLTLQTCVIRFIPKVADSWYLECYNWILARTQAVWQTQKVSKQARFGWGVSSMYNMRDDTAITSCNSCGVCWWCLVLWMYCIHSIAYSWIRPFFHCWKSHPPHQEGRLEDLREVPPVKNSGIGGWLK